MATVFFSYSHRDEGLRDELEVHLAMLKRNGVIETWHDRRITAGETLDDAIGGRVETDDVILALASPDFLASSYCYDREMTRALERHDAGEAVVIPVILRPCAWQDSPLGRLRATPRDGLPVTKWPDRDDAFVDVAKDIKAAVGKLTGRAPTVPPAASAAVGGGPLPEGGRAAGNPGMGDPSPRSSNLSVAKRFTDRERDRFRLDAFEYMAAFFENSLAELGERNPGLEGGFRRVDANRFFATVYRDGEAVSRATVFMGGMMGNGISYVSGEKMESNTYNEQLTIDADDQSLFLRSYGMQRGNAAAKLTFEGAAEGYWASFMQPLRLR